METLEQINQETEKVSFKQLRDIREILGQIEDKDRSKFVDLLDRVAKADFTFKDLIGILEEDCGEYVGSWAEPNDAERE